MSTLVRGIRFATAALTVLILILLGFILALRSVPQLRWRATLVRLKVEGGLPDITWVELLHMNRSGDPFDLKELIKTPSPYFAITNPFTSTEDIAAGQRIFHSGCVLCHGANGMGGPGGPELKGHHLRQGSSDWAIFKTISNGVPGTAMPASTLPEDDRWKLVGYVKTLVQSASSSKVATNPAIASLAPVTYEEILGAGQDTHRWLTYSGSYDGHRFSLNDQINTANAPKLRLLWMRQYITWEKTIETSPLIVDGVMFVTVPPNGVEAIDAKTGAVIWHYDRELPQHLSICCGYVNRGLAVLKSMVFFGTLDSHLLAMDIKTGAVVWDAAVADYQAGYTITGAPLALKNMVITGVAGGEFGARGFISARDSDTGKELWRFETIPTSQEPGAQTWEANSWKTGGGPTWLTGTFDPELNLLYWPVGNPSPDYNGTNRKGDNLYTDSVVALDPDRGSLRWYFQFTPHDVFDWDAAEILVSIDRTVAGKRERFLAQANRNAFYYLLDRENGQFRSAQPFAKEMWAKQIDSVGRPVVNQAAMPSLEGAAVEASATNWMSPSYDPLTDLMYVPVTEDAGVLYLRTADYPPSEKLMGGYFQPYTDPPPEIAIRALDASTGQVRWEHRETGRDIGGVLSTKGGVVFGSIGSVFLAFDAKTGRELWHFDTGGVIKAAPVTFSLDGKQFVTVAAGQDLLTFGL